MPLRNHVNWLKQPKVEHISSEIYSSQELFEQEQRDIFSKAIRETFKGSRYTGLQLELEKNKISNKIILSRLTEIYRQKK